MSKDGCTQLYPAMSPRLVSGFLNLMVYLVLGRGESPVCALTGHVRHSDHHKHSVRLTAQNCGSDCPVTIAWVSPALWPGEQVHLESMSMASDRHCALGLHLGGFCRCVSVRACVRVSSLSPGCLEYPGLSAVFIGWPAIIRKLEIWYSNCSKTGTIQGFISENPTCWIFVAHRKYFLQAMCIQYKCM